ncbi:hypothetical protein QR680_007383 [Steinernema hermaphroditum]|uniref:DUF8206 domain-containing protein n=1 Tax=Steinernema hermaphroditum TaxID=289476 RepID=A0AA39IEF8_9BILA|nr:hypothetical protein QR680_007383 [Steinernema hermaphroditum]
MAPFEPVKLHFTPPGFEGNIVCRNDQSVYRKKSGEDGVYECLKCPATVKMLEDEQSGWLQAPHQHQEEEPQVEAPEGGQQGDGNLDSVWAKAVSDALSTENDASHSTPKAPTRLYPLLPKETDAFPSEGSPASSPQAAQRKIYTRSVSFGPNSQASTPQTPNGKAPVGSFAGRRPFVRKDSFVRPAPNPLKISVQGVVKEPDDAVWSFDELIDAESITVQDIIHHVYKLQVSAKRPEKRFGATVKKWKPLFEKFYFVDSDYDRTFATNGEAYQITFVDMGTGLELRQHSIVVEPDDALKVTNGADVSKPRRNGDSTIENEEKPMRIRRLASLFEQQNLEDEPSSEVISSKVESGHSETAPQTEQPQDEENKVMTSIFKAFFLTEGAEMCYEKVVEYESGNIPMLRKIVEEIFYDDNDWCQSSCFAEIQKKVPGFGYFMDVASDYGSVECENKTEYEVKYYDVACYSKENRSSFVVDLPGVDLPASTNSSNSGLNDPNFFRTKAKKLEPFKGDAQKKALVRMRCPMGCAEETLAWNCASCGDYLYYDFADSLFCKCGIHNSKLMSLKCSYGDHDYISEGVESKIDEAIEDIGECNEFNVVLLGETGAGKSTWLNSIFNYLPFKTLEAAIEADKIHVPIPSYFQLTDEDGNTTKVLVGEEDDNECLEIGQSATQNPKTYTFMYESNFYRFIDVPGIGDCRGPKQDRLNFQMIMDELQNYKHIHAICILTPADFPRLNVMFRFCIQELLIHLHQDAVKNIVFCFTRAQSTNYMAGNTQFLLRKMLDQYKEKRGIEVEMSRKNMFFFDNEGFRYLCAYRQNLDLHVASANVANSWNVSAHSTRAILDYITTIKPHDTRKMLSINEAKRIINQLTPIAAEITRNIDRNIKIVKQKMAELKDMDAEYIKLQPFLKIKQNVISDYHPKMVCASAKCSETVPIPGTDKTVTIYKEPCHKRCVVPFSSPGVHPNRHLKRCCIMTDGKCIRCGCSWDVHVHIRHQHDNKVVEIENTELKKYLDGQLQEQVKVVNVIDSYKARNAKLCDQKKRIQKITVKFMAFLHFNAIAVVNDTYEEYLATAIRSLEEDILEDNTKEITQLRTLLSEHKNEVTLLKENIENKSVQEITLADVDRMKNELRNMDELGLQFKGFMMALDSATEVNFRMAPFVITVKWSIFVENQFISREKEKFFLKTPSLLELAKQIHQKLRIDKCFQFVRIAYIDIGIFLSRREVDSPAKTGDDLEFRFLERPLAEQQHKQSVQSAAKSLNGMNIDPTAEQRNLSNQAQSQKVDNTRNVRKTSTHFPSVNSQGCTDPPHNAEPQLLIKHPHLPLPKSDDFCPPRSFSRPSSILVDDAAPQHTPPPIPPKPARLSAQSPSEITFSAQLDLAKSHKRPLADVQLNEEAKRPHLTNGDIGFTVPIVPEDPTTIVLLGETGVGKSTFVNAICNYLKFDTLGEAESSADLNFLIPAQFNFGDQKIVVGVDQNEELNDEGASATQRPKAYEFAHGNKTYRIIDVPGIGDSRGLEQDQKNFDMIVEEINKYPQIHAVCILMPSEGARLTVAMKYCIHELLSNLHQDVAKNIVFCFTKTRATFYKNGGTYSLLERYLQKLEEKQGVNVKLNRDTTYFFDNEAFRFLCIQKKTGALDNQRVDMVKSWDISRENAKRLLDYVFTLPPHDTRQMAALSEAKRVVMKIAQLAAEVNALMTNGSIVTESTHRNKIEQICAKCSAFLRQNALSARSDDYVTYLKSAIETAEHEAMLGEGNEKLLDLKNSLNSYERQVSILEHSNDIQQKVNVDEIYELKSQLQQLAAEYGIYIDKKSTISTV